jgi:glutamine cyclotransferase
VKITFPRFAKTAGLAFFLFAFCWCGLFAEIANSSVPTQPVGETDTAPTRFTYTVINTWPHATAAFTQGLVFYEGHLLESTGLKGESTLRSVDLTTGRVEKTVSLPSEYFAEGLAVIGNRAYQLTWQNHQGFIYDTHSFRREGEFAYEGEGWGLTSDGKWLILSDGTDQLRFLDPTTFQVIRIVHVTAAGVSITRINELEWVKGEIFANVWLTNAIIRIDPENGNVRGIIDFSRLLPTELRQSGTDVLNGIAYDSDHDRLFITGKRWPALFEVRLIESPRPPAQ